MLVIRRRPGEALLVGAGVEIRVLEMTPSRVTLGIVADPQIVILRKEAAEQAERNRQAAASSERAELTGLAQRLRQFPAPPLT
jgi:carbon storage regulator CsrA